MRRTGKLYNLTIVSSLLAILASILIIFWNENSSPVHLWIDIVPQGFGMASFITTTLIVRVAYAELSKPTLTFRVQAMIAGVARQDMAVATGSKDRN